MIIVGMAAQVSSAEVVVPTPRWTTQCSVDQSWTAVLRRQTPRLREYDAYASKPDKEITRQDHIELSVKVMEGPKNDALKCAMDSGCGVVVAPHGALTIAEAIKPSWASTLEIAIASWHA